MTDELVQYVSHPKFGAGQLIGGDAQYGEAMFLEGGRKRFHRDFVAKLLSEPPSQEEATALAKLCAGLAYLRPGEVVPAREAAAKKRSSRVRKRAPAKKATKKATKKPAKKAAKKPAKKAAKKATKKAAKKPAKKAAKKPAKKAAK